MNHDIDLSPFIGIPYIDKGTDPAVGLDCWQLVKYFYKRQLGKDIPDYMAFYESSLNIRGAAKCIAQALPDWTKVQDYQFGDVIVFRITDAPWHTGIYLANGSGLMLHTDEGHGSCIESMNGLKWRNRIYGVYRWNS